MGSDMNIFDELSWLKVHEIDKLKRNSMESSKYFAVKLPDNYGDILDYHTKC